MHLVRKEPEVPEALDVFVGQVREDLARARPLKLDVGKLLRDGLDVEVEVADDVAEVVEVGVERSDDPAARLRELEDGPVPDHLAVLVAERPVADLPDLESE